MLHENSKRNGLNNEIVKIKFKDVAAKQNQRRRTVTEFVRKGKQNNKKNNEKTTMLLKRSTIM